MIRRWTITLVIICVAVVLGTVWHRCARTVPLAECSEVYRRYADTPGVNAAYIKDYRVNDSVTVCVTLLEATDSASWENLQEDFKVKIPDEVLKIMNGEIPNRNIKLAPKNDYRLPMDTVFTNNDFIVTLRHNHIISIFHLESREQYNAVRNKQFDEMNPKF